MLRNQTLGLLGIMGGACYMLGGLRMLFLAYGEDRVTDIFGIAWAVGWVFAGLALLRMRVTGATRFGRAVSIVLIAGFACASLWGIHRLIDAEAADHGPFAIAPMIVILGMLGSGRLGYLLLGTAIRTQASN